MNIYAAAADLCSFHLNRNWNSVEFTNGFGFNSLPVCICIEIICTEVDEEMRGRASPESPFFKAVLCLLLHRTALFSCHFSSIA